jgi:ATP-dependent RNA helicase RhlE
VPSFNDLSLSEGIIRNLANEGYLNPTEVQTQAIPLLLAGKDLLALAQTGTGKTAAFCLPAIQKLRAAGLPSRPGQPRVLILVPTRELCLQIADGLGRYGRDLEIKVAAIFGGVEQSGQVSALRAGVDIMVATPGRLVDLLGQQLVKLSLVSVLVLDEADRMMDLGFTEEIEQIIDLLPATRQTALFSATMPSALEGLARNLLKNPARVEVAPSGSVAEAIEQKVILCKQEHKFQLLKKILKEETGLVLVFTRTRETADAVVEYLKQNRMAARALHGEKNQKHRLKALEEFGQGVMRVLVATDIASRGIDVPDIEHVINFELPQEPEVYVHRVGRTARAGAAGRATSFCAEHERNWLERIQRLIGEILPSEHFVGKFEALRLERRVKAPTPGKNQGPGAYLDHSKRQSRKEDGSLKFAHPAFKKKKRRK